jgi:hypothetical protein
MADERILVLEKKVEELEKRVQTLEAKEAQASRSKLREKYERIVLGRR